MPILGLGEHRLHPHPPFAHGLLVGEGATVAPDPIHVALVVVAQDLPAVLALRALRAQRTCRAGGAIGLVLGELAGSVVRKTPEPMSGRAQVRVILRLVGELVLAEERSCLARSG